MSREHADLIEQAKASPDIESALENTFTQLATRCKDVASRNDVKKSAAMGNQLAEDTGELIDAILDHSQVFKAKPAVVEQRTDRLKNTPKTAERKYDKDGNPIEVVEVKETTVPETLSARQSAWDRMSIPERTAKGQPSRPTV
jgi:hypothetical protein